jgi:hypothetical protein
MFEFEVMSVVVMPGGRDFCEIYKETATPPSSAN